MATVRVLKTFIYHDRMFEAGKLVDVEPVTASILARQQRVSLSVERWEVPDTIPTPKPEEPVRRRRRSYRRRDLVAETQ